MEDLNGLKDRYFGKTWRDVIGGFAGVATGLQVWASGIVDVCLDPRSLDKDGKPLPGHWFDSGRLEHVQVEPIDLTSD